MYIASVAAVVVATGVLIGCERAVIAGGPADPDTYEGRYVGYSWAGEADGTNREEADSYIETILELDPDGIIIDARMRFWVQIDGYRTTRQSGNAYVSVDYAIDPEPATPGDDYAPGESMFTVYTADMMSFYAVAVSDDTIAAATIVDPITRYRFEIKLPADFNFDTPMRDFTVGSELLVPTERTSAAALLRPQSWDELADNHLFDISPWSHVLNEMGELEDLDADSSIREFLEALGMTFEQGTPQPMAADYGYFGRGGWAGNYRAIEEDLIGRDAREYTSLVDWSISRYGDAVNEDNVFGVDVPSGATQTVQDSVDGISGATVRMSRESTSYQRALVEAGILAEDEVVIGRF